MNIEYFPGTNTVKFEVTDVIIYDSNTFEILIGPIPVAQIETTYKGQFD